MLVCHVGTVREMEGNVYSAERLMVYREFVVYVDVLCEKLITFLHFVPCSDCHLLGGKKEALCMSAEVWGLFCFGLIHKKSVLNVHIICGLLLIGECLY